MTEGDSQDLGKMWSLTRKHWPVVMAIAALIGQIISIEVWRAGVNRDLVELRVHNAQFRGELDGKSSSGRVAKTEEKIESLAGQVVTVRDEMRGVVHRIELQLERICVKVRCER